MADDERKSFWRRLREKLGGDRATPDPAEAGRQEPGQESRATPDETPVPGADKPEQAPAAKSEPPPVEKQPAENQQTEPPPVPTVAGGGAPSVLSTSELKTDTVGRVYAEALLELAQDQGLVDTIADEVQQLLPLIAEGGELHRLLTNPAISDDERGKIVQTVFGGKVSGLLYNLLRLLGDKGRLGSLPSVAAGYLLAVAELRGLVDVQAFVAEPLDADTAKRVGDQIGAALGKTVTLRQKVDPSLIGGLKIKVGDQLIDASVASQLRSMRNKMIAAGRG